MLLDLESKEYQDIEREANAVNIFNVLKLTRAEIRHSNFLAWLLDPNENHGLGATFSRYFFYEVFNNLKDLDDCHFDFGKLFLESIDNFMIYRERFNIDILMVAENQLVCIENKIDTFTHDQQLTHYREKLDLHYHNHEKLFLYLTPTDEDISDYSDWHKISYQAVSNALQKILDSTPLNPATKILIEDYQKIIKGEIMNEDTEIEKLCLEIYRKHKTAFDLIDKYRPNDDLKISDEINEFLQSRQDIVYENGNYNAGKNCLKFTTNTMLNLLPKSPTMQEELWTKGCYFLYEIHLKSKEIKAVLFHCIDSDRNKQRIAEQKINQIFNLSQTNRQGFNIKKQNCLNTNWQYYTVYVKPLLPNRNADDNVEETIKKLKNSLTTFIEKELPEFENKIKTTLAPIA
ncbi:MAG: PD-(D/E)XK nuclease family protein [Prevotella sp.]|nr:PD-(D/E)XK nuclease family protein [Prevotella sp.]